MSVKSIVLGLLLAFSIAAFTFFSNHVIGGENLVGHYFPIGIFGVIMALLIFVNPLLGAVSSKLPFSPKELAIAASLGLAACAWHSDFFSHVVQLVSMPPHHLEKTRTDWQAQNVLSYVPGASPLLGQGHVTDWGELAGKISANGRPDYGPARRIREMLEERHLRVFEEMAWEPRPPPGRIDSMTRALNQVMESPLFYCEEAFADVEPNETAQGLLEEGIEELTHYRTKRLNRALLVSAFPELVLPAPEGEGLMLSMDEDGAAVAGFLLDGSPVDDRLSLREIPWDVWWPNIRFWGGLALLEGNYS